MKFNIPLLFLIVLTLPLCASANVIGSITTDKDLYDVNETISVTYTLAGTGNNDPLSTDIFVEGYMPTYNNTSMSKFDFIGSRDFEGGSNKLLFKTIKSIKLEDTLLGGSSFIPIPPIRGTFNAFVHTPILGSNEFNNYLGKVVIYETTNNVNKTIYITLY